jgi:hypothetical protein
MAEVKEQERRDTRPVTHTSRSAREGEQTQLPEDAVGLPMRKDDRQNQFRAPDNKPQGSFFGENMTQAGPPPETPGMGPKEGEASDVPEETHAQVAPPLAEAIAGQKPPDGGLDKPPPGTDPPLGGSRSGNK